MKSLYISKDNHITVTPDSAIINRGRPWFMPDDISEWYGNILIGTSITRVGMHIAERFAHRYYGAFSAAVHPNSANDVECVQWCRDGALITGPGQIDASTQGTLTLTAAGSTLSIQADDLRSKIDKAIAYVSSFITLKTGDLILIDTELPKIAIAEGTDFDVDINNENMLHFKSR